jgi:hypothetical protein
MRHSNYSQQYLCSMVLFVQGIIALDRAAIDLRTVHSIAHYPASLHLGDLT